MLKHVKIRTRQTKSEEDGKSDIENKRAGVKDDTNMFSGTRTVEYEKIDEKFDYNNLVKGCNSTDLSQSEIEKRKTESPLYANVIQYVSGEQSLILDENAQETPSTISVTDEVEKSNSPKQNNEISAAEPQKIEILRTYSTSRSEYYESNSIYETMLSSKTGLIRQVRKGSFTNRYSCGYQTHSLNRCSSFQHVLRTESRIEEHIGKELSGALKAMPYECYERSKGQSIEFSRETKFSALPVEQLTVIDLETQTTGNHLDPEKGVIGLLNSETRKNHKFLSFCKNLKLFLTTFMAVISTLSVIVFYLYLGSNIILGTPFPKHLYILNLFALCLISFTLILLCSSRNTKISRIIIYNIVLIIFTILSFLISAIKENYY